MQWEALGNGKTSDSTVNLAGRMLKHARSSRPARVPAQVRRGRLLDGVLQTRLQCNTNASRAVPSRHVYDAPALQNSGCASSSNQTLHLRLQGGNALQRHSAATCSCQTSGGSQQKQVQAGNACVQAHLRRVCALHRHTSSKRQHRLHD
jgi:hypothetical protein